MGVKELIVAQVTMDLHKAKKNKSDTIALVVLFAIGGALMFLMPILMFSSSQYGGETNEETLDRWDRANEFYPNTPKQTIASVTQSSVILGLMFGTFAVIMFSIAVGTYSKTFKKYNEEVFREQTRFDELMK